MSIPETHNKNKTPRQSPRRIGIFAAAGNATRLNQNTAHTIGSKEILRVRNIRTRWHTCMQRLHPLATADPEIPVGNYLIDNFLHGGVDECIIVTRPEKVDLLNYYSAKSIGNMQLKRLAVGPTPGTPWTVAHALQSALERYEPEQKQNSALANATNLTFALGFPDIVTAPENVFHSLFSQLDNTDCDAVLGLFRVSETRKYDMVHFESSATHRKHVMGIDIKPDDSELEWTWVCAVWTVAFSRYLIDYTNSQADSTPKSCSNGEVYIGDILLSAIREGFKIDCLCLENGTVLDIGTPADLELARSAEMEKLFS